MTLEEFEKLPEVNDGWVEWPTFDEDDEERFDWSLSYAEMEKLYPSGNYVSPKKKRKRNFFYKQPDFNYKQSTSFPTHEKRREQAVSSIGYLNYLGKDCPCVGFIDRGFSLNGMAGVKPYQNAYYHSGEQKYLFMVHGGVLAYPKDKVEKFIKPFFPNEEKKSDTNSLPQPRSMSHHQWKKNKQTIAESVKKEIIESPTIVAEKRKAETEARERNIFISHMTMEQFGLMQKHGWRIAKLLTAPEEYFHY